jgi:hypothetical protein
MAINVVELTFQAAYESAKCCEGERGAFIDGPYLTPDPA